MTINVLDVLRSKARGKSSVTLCEMLDGDQRDYYAMERMTRMRQQLQLDPSWFNGPAALYAIPEQLWQVSPTPALPSAEKLDSG